MAKSPPTYYAKRMAEIGISNDLNKIDIYQTDIDNIHGPPIKKTLPIFRETNEGIDIFVYTIDRLAIPFAKEGSRWKNKDYCITRLAVPKVKKDGSVMKYQMPAGQQTQPFFPPELCESYENQTKIKTLILTEGYFKAFKAYMHGIPCVGLPSITCMKDKNTGKLHADVLKLIQVCQVELLVWLCDGDCLDITKDEITEKKDLYKRPYNFFSSVETFYNLTSTLEFTEKSFAYINTNNIENKPKGLDDLLIEMEKLNRVNEVSTDLLDYSAVKEGWSESKFFTKTKLWSGLGRVHKKFMLDNVDKFYLYHSELRPELKGQPFKFNGTIYKYNEDESKCEKLVPKDANDYFRCGTDYYKIIFVPNKYAQDERRVVKWDKTSIRDDLGKDIFKHIAKYESFCNVPDHINYQLVIHSCYNSYSPFEWEPEPGDIDVTLGFIKHIFGTKEINWKNPKNNIVKIIHEYELGLDYLTLLYKKPQQILPILCLISSERQTGKTTFLKYMKILFTGNAAVVGNQDLAADFNSHWTSKLLIMCDETKIDKQIVMEKVKALSTQDRIMSNAKGKDQFEMDFFGKFIFASNNEDNFANVDEAEIRFWVRKVLPFGDKERNVDLLADLQNEIPAFLNYINTRPLATEYSERHHFDTNLIKTDALTKVVSQSKPTIEKELKAKLKAMFLDFNQTDIYLTLATIKQEFFKKDRYEDYYLEKVLKDWGCTREEKVSRRQYYRWQEVRDKIGSKDGEDMDISKIVAMEIKTQGRHFHFQIENFCTQDEIDAMKNKIVSTPDIVDTEDGNLPF